MRIRYYTMSMAAAAVIAAGWLAPAQAAGNKPEVSHLRIPLTGSITVKKDACLKSDDTVTFSSDSDVFVVAVDKRSGGFVHANLAGVTGTGTSGDTYIGAGAHRYTDVTFPAGGNGSVDLPAHDFKLVHTDGCASTPLPVNITLQFVNGRLVESGSKAVAGP